MVFALLVVFCNTGSADSTISSERELKEEVARLQDPDTQISALEHLIKFSGIFLYETSVVWISDDRIMDNLRRSARKALHNRSDPEIVEMALNHEDREVRFWGVMNFETIHGRMDSWKPFLPLLKKIALEDGDSNIRAEAIRRLKSYDMDFIRDLRSKTTEGSPWVLMNLLGFGSGKPELRAKFYERSVQHLSHEDAAVRNEWLVYLQMNAWNPSTAEMWRIESDPGLIAKLKEIEAFGSPNERELATKTINTLSKGKQQRTQQGAAEQPATAGEPK